MLWKMWVLYVLYYKYYTFIKKMIAIMENAMFSWLVIFYCNFYFLFN